jgi:hypothetical protein
MCTCIFMHCARICIHLCTCIFIHKRTESTTADMRPTAASSSTESSSSLEEDFDNLLTGKRVSNEAHDDASSENLHETNAGSKHRGTHAGSSWAKHGRHAKAVVPRRIDPVRLRCLMQCAPPVVPNMTSICFGAFWAMDAPTALLKTPP